MTSCDYSLFCGGKFVVLHSNFGVLHLNFGVLLHLNNQLGYNLLVFPIPMWNFKVSALTSYPWPSYDWMDGVDTNLQWRPVIIAFFCGGKFGVLHSNYVVLHLNNQLGYNLLGVPYSNEKISRFRLWPLISLTIVWLWMFFCDGVPYQCIHSGYN